MQIEEDRRKFLYLDGLRGLAAAIIALGHFSEWSSIKLDNVMSLWVGFFFILSGFVLTHAYWHRVASGGLSFRDYIVLRLSRLYPLHLVTGLLAAFILLGVYGVRVLKFSLGYGWDNPAIAPPEFICGLTETIEAFTLTHFLLGGGVCFNTPSWSIGVEFWCSLFAFFLFLSGYRGLKIFALILIACAFAAVQMKGGFLQSPGWVGGFLEKNYVTGFGCFALGWLIARTVRPHTSKVARIIGWVSVVGAVWFTTGGVTWLKTLTPFHEIVFYALCVLILFCFSTTHTPGNKKYSALLQRSGAYSYGIYLWHMPVILFLNEVVFQMQLRFSISLKETVILQVIYIAVVLVAAYFSFSRLEQPAKYAIRHGFLSVQS